MRFACVFGVRHPVPLCCGIGRTKGIRVAHEKRRMYRFRVTRASRLLATASRRRELLGRRRSAVIGAKKEVRCGETPQPARETRALPGMLCAKRISNAKHTSHSRIAAIRKTLRVEKKYNRASARLRESALCAVRCALCAVRCALIIYYFLHQFFKNRQFSQKNQHLFSLFH